MQNLTLIENLELRSLLSSDVTPTVSLDEARSAVVTAVEHFKADLTATQKALAERRAALSAFRQTSEQTLRTLRDAVEAHKREMVAELKVNAKAGKEVRSTFTPILRAGELDVRTDSEGESEQERIADRAKLEKDRSDFRAAMQAVETETRADKAKWELALRTDKQTIESTRKQLETQTRTLKNLLHEGETYVAGVLKADKKAIRTALEAFRKAGGKVSELNIERPKLEEAGKSRK